MPEEKPLLETHGLTKRFDGFAAVDDVTLKVGARGIHGLIGPNGAGKTTLLNLISGRLKPTGGVVLFLGEDITGLPPHQVSRKGVAYTFQLTNIFPGLRVFDNVKLSINAKRRGSGDLEGNGRVEEILRQVGLSGKGDLKASELSHGDLRRLEIGVALGLDPRLILMDEPTQGTSAGEAWKTAELIKSIGERRAVLLVEHNVEIVFRLAEVVTVMDYGRIIAEGSPKEIVEDEKVKRAYLAGLGYA